MANNAGIGVQNSFRLVCPYCFHGTTKKRGTAMFEALTVMSVLFVALFGGLTFAAMRNSMTGSRQTVRVNEKARR